MTGHHCPSAKYGYLRTYRPDLEQLESGLLVTPKGLPITHEVQYGGQAYSASDPCMAEKIVYHGAMCVCRGSGNGERQDPEDVGRSLVSVHCVVLKAFFMSQVR